MIVHSTPCRTTIQLCARVALMVGVALFLSAIPPSEPQQFSVRFTLNALAVKSIGTMLMHALNLSEQKQDHRPLKQRSVLSSLSSSLIIHWHSMQGIQWNPEGWSRYIRRRTRLWYWGYRSWWVAATCWWCSCRDRHNVIIMGPQCNFFW